MFRTFLFFRKPSKDIRGHQGTPRGLLKAPRIAVRDPLAFAVLQVLLLLLLQVLFLILVQVLQMLLLLLLLLQVVLQVVLQVGLPSRDLER